MEADEARSSQEELAHSLQSRSRLLVDAGRSEEALDAAEKAVHFYRKLAADDPGKMPHLASGLQSLSLALAATGRAEEAMRVSEEAVALYQDLAAASPALYRSDLANSMSNRLGILDAAGRSSEALGEAQEAVSYLRRAADQDPDRHLPDLAGALNNLSNRLAQAGEEPKALLTAEEAVAALRQAASQNPSRLARDLAAGLGNLSLRLADAGHDEEALAAHREALSIFRDEAARDPARSDAELAGALSYQAILLDRANRPDEAAAAATEAVERWRVVLERTGSVEADLAGALNNLSIVLDKNDRTDEAVDAALEATALFRVLATDDRNRFVPHLALALSNLSKSLTSANRREEAVLALEAAIEARRPMARTGAGRNFAVDLAGSLNDLTFLLAALGREEQAIASGREALERYRELAAAEPGVFAPDLSRTLSNMAIMLESLGKHDEAAGLIDETLAGFSDPQMQGVLELARGVWRMNNDDVGGAVLSGWHALRALEGLQSGGHAAQARSFLRALREYDAEGFDGAWRKEIGHELPVWLRYPGEDPELRSLLVEWLMTDTWEASREFATEHRAALLSDEAHAQLLHMADQQPDQSELTRHLAILGEAREFGIGEAFSMVLDAVGGRRRREQLNSWLWRDLDESVDYLREHVDELLDPRTAEDLTDEALKQPEEPGLWARVALLNLCRTTGVDTGSSLFEQEIKGEPLTVWKPETPDPKWTLDLARLGAGLHRHSAERQFLHALAAAETNHPQEADQAISRCRSLLASWDIGEYASRLDELIAAREDRGEDWRRLRQGLTERPVDSGS